MKLDYDIILVLVIMIALVVAAFILGRACGVPDEVILESLNEGFQKGLEISQPEY